MKSKPILVTVLMFLFIAPMIFISSYGGVAIPAEQNTNKDFALSTEYEESDQSITSFSETLPDDIMFRPDSFPDDTPLFLTIGEGLFNDFNDTYVIDGLNWAADDDREYADCQILSNVESFSYSVYAYGHDGDGYLHIWNGTDWVLLETFTETLEIHSWYNGTLDDQSYVLAGNIIRLGISSGAAFEWAAVDYLQITADYMTLADDDHYAESFADVSDWEDVEHYEETEQTHSTDNDVMTFAPVNDDNPDWDYLYSNNPSLSSAFHYYEIRYKFNTTSFTSAVFTGWAADISNPAQPASAAIWASLTKTTSWTTLKGSYNGALESVGIAIATGTGQSVEIDIDYLRISPANESGWQHDASTTYGLTTYAGAVVSDGDSLNFSAPVGVTGYWDLSFANPTTLAYIDPNYYPFMKYSISDCSDVNAWTIRHYYGGGHYYGAYADDTIGINYENLLAGTGGSNDRYKLRIWCNPDEWFILDYLKIYSIANYTVTQSGTSVDDVLYVSDGTLYCEGTSFTSITLDHDPALDESRLGFWDMDTSSGTPEIDLYIDGAWEGYTTETEGYYEIIDLTDLRLKFTGNANVEGITFYSIPPQWYDIGIAELYFSVPLDESIVNALLIFGGLFLIPISTLYLVKGGKEALSADKFFYFCIAFVIGWALLLGGIG